MADHNDPNAVNSIFSDIDVSGADLYDIFGFPSDTAPDEKVVIALTFAAVPQGGRIGFGHALPDPDRARPPDRAIRGWGYESRRCF